MPHFIRKQRLELNVHTPNDAFRLQQLASEHYWRSLLPSIEIAFDQVATGDDILEIDKLEIDLGIITEKDILRGAWADILRKKILERLKLVKKVDISEEKSSPVKEAIVVTEQWLFYMQKGYLPWNVHSVDKNWYTSVLESFATDHKASQRLRDALARSLVISERIVVQHDIQFIVHLLEAISTKSQHMLRGMIAETIQLIGVIKAWNKKEMALKANKLQQKILIKLLQISARQGNQFNAEKMIGEIITAYFRAATKPITLPEKFFSKSRLTADLLGQILNQVAKNLYVLNGDKTGTELVNEIIPYKKVSGNEPINEVPPKTDVTGSSEEHETTDDLKFSVDAHLEDDAIYAGYTGLVLLNPFLSKFFSNMGLIDNKLFVDMYAQQKAVQFLFFLATGEDQPAEYELMIAKILCGYPQHMPMSELNPLNKNEMEEGELLLKNVIHHWSILKNTSIQGLRESFLQRDGKISFSNDGPLIQVEKKSIDILLSEIPWGFRMIQLPWCKNLIRVEW